MITREWNGVGDYDSLLVLSEEEMRLFADHFQVDWSFFTDGPRKSINGQYFCFVNHKRKVYALLPFLSLAFGGMYNEDTSVGEELAADDINYDDFSLEPFSY